MISVDRRTYLRTLAPVSLGTLAGCLDAVPAVGGDGDTALPPPEEPRGQPIHPIHGDEFPEFSLPDPLTGQEVSASGLRGERPFVMTFVYTSCPDACGTLVRLLQLLQADALERGYADDLALLAMTFDPETDDAEAVRTYSELFEVDLDAGHFHFLRPASNNHAHSLMNDTFGVPMEFPDDGDHHHDDAEALRAYADLFEVDLEAGHFHFLRPTTSDQAHSLMNDTFGVPMEFPDDGGYHHDEDDADDGDHHHDEDDAHPLHYYMLFVVNEAGIVERSYPNVVDGREETRPAAIIEDVRTVVG